MAGISDGFPDQQALGSFIHDANRLHAIPCQSSSVSNQWQNEFHPPHSFSQSARLQNECGALSNYHPRMSNMQRPRYFIHQNPAFYYSQRFPPWMSRFQHGQQNQQIAVLHSRFQASAPSDHSGMNVGSSLQVITAVAPQQQHSSSQTNSHTVPVGRSIQILSGHLPPPYSSSSATLTAPTNPSEHSSIHSQRPQETFLPGYHQQQQNISSNTSSGVHPVPSEHNSAHVQRPQQTFIPGNSHQQYTSSNTSSGVHPVPSEHSSAHVQRPQQTFIPGNSLQQNDSSNTSSGVHPVPSEHNSAQAQRPQQTFIPGNSLQQYTSSNTSSGVHPVPSEHNSAQAQRPQQTFIPGNSLQQYTSSNTSSGVHPVLSEHNSAQAQRPQQTFIPGNSQKYTSSNTSSGVHPVPSEHNSAQAQRPQQTFIPGNSQQHFHSSNTCSGVHPVPSEHNSAQAHRPQQTFIPGNSHQQYTSSNTSSDVHPVHSEHNSAQAQRPQQTFIPGNSHQQYTSSNTSSDVHPVHSEHNSAQAQRPQQTFIPGNSHQQYTSFNTSSGVHPVHSEHNSAQAQRPQQTFIPGNSQKYTSSNTNSGVHPVPSEHNSAQAQRPQQTFIPGNSQQHFNSSNTGSGVHLANSLNSIHAQRPQQTFLPGIEQQYYTSSRTGSDVHPTTSEQNVAHAQRLQQTFIPGDSQQHNTSSNTGLPVHQPPSENSIHSSSIQTQRPVRTGVSGNPQQQYRSSNTTSDAHLTSSSQTDNLLSGMQPKTYSNLIRELLKGNTKTTSVNYSKSSTAAPASSAVHLTAMSLQQQVKEHQSIDRLNDFGIVKNTGSAAYYEVPCNYMPLQQHSQVPAQQPYLNNSHGLHEMSSSNQSVGASLLNQGLGSKINNLVSAHLQRKRGKRAKESVHYINKDITPDIASVNIGNPNLHLLCSVNEYQESGETELRHCNMEQDQASTNNSVNKPRWYRYPETAVVPSFQSDIEAMQTDLTNYTTSCSATARFSIADPENSNEPSVGVCTDIHITDNQTSSVGVAHRDVNLFRKENTPETGYQDVIENRSEKQLTAPIKQELPDNFRVPEANSLVEITVFSISDLSQSDVSSRSDTSQRVEVGTGQELSKCLNSSTSSDVSPANSSSINREAHCSSKLDNSEVIPHTHAGNDHLFPSPIGASGLMRDGDLTNMSNQDKVSETGVLTHNSIQISGNDVNSDSATLEKDTSVVAKHQHCIFQRCIFQPLKPIYENRENKKSESKLALLPGRLQSRRQTSPYLGKNSNEACESNAARLSTSRLSLDSSTSSQSKLQSKMRNTYAQTLYDQRKCVTSKLIDSATSKLIDSKSGGKHKSGDQKQPSSCENSLSAKEKVYNMWKVGCVMQDKRTGKKNQRKESAKITRITNYSKQTDKNQQVIKSPDMNSAATKGLVVKKTSADKTMNKAKPKAATGKTALIKANILKRPKIQKPAGKICNVIIHGHKLLCFKSKTEDLILLSEFQFTCFPDKTVGSFNCIDHMLGIKKGVLEHPKKDTIVKFLKKLGCDRDSLMHTISVNDGRKIYHYLHGIETCTTSMCVVEIPDAVSFVDLSLTKSTLKINKEAHILEENHVNKSPVTIDVADGQEVFAIETLQSGSDSPNRQSSGVSRKSSQCEDMATVISDSDETLAYGGSSDSCDVDEVESVLNNPFVIRWLPGTPKIGGIFKTILGNLRSYRHNRDCYLAVDDVCKILNPTDFCDRVQKDNLMLYSCCKEIESFLNELDSNFSPLKSQHQCLVKETDIGIHEDNAYQTSGHHESSVLKRTLDMQGDCNENNIPHKHPRLADDALLTDSHNLMNLELAPSLVTQDSNSQSVISLVKVHNPSEYCPGSMLKRTEATGLTTEITGLTTEITGLTTEDAHSENPPRENSQISAVTKSIPYFLTPCLDEENGLTSSGDHLTVEKYVNNSNKLLQHPETEMIYMIDITSSMDTDSYCRNTDSVFDQSVIRQHDLLSPESDRSTFSPDESLSNSGKLILNQDGWNSHEPHLLLVSCEDLNTISKDTLDKCETSQVQAMSVQYFGEHEVKKVESNSCHLETTDKKTLTTNTPSERSVADVPFESFLCSLKKDDPGRDNMSVSSTVHTDAGFSRTLQVQTTEDDNPGYIILHANQNEVVSDITTDIVVNSTSDTHRRDRDQMVCIMIIDDEVSNCDKKGTEKTADAPACGKLSSEHKVLQKSSLLANLASDVDTGTDYLLPTYVQSVRSRRCVDDMDIITCSNASMLVPLSYRRAYANLWQQYSAVLGENIKLTKKCKDYEDLVHKVTSDYKLGLP